MQGSVAQTAATGKSGDFMVRRADGLFAYQFAVVVDDAGQRISHVVRGADLLGSTPRQVYLQRLLGYADPDYLHLPVAVNAAGEKLGKQTRAPARSSPGMPAHPAGCAALPEPAAAGAAGDAEPAELLRWAIEHWDVQAYPARPAPCPRPADTPAKPHWRGHFPYI